MSGARSPLIDGFRPAAAAARPGANPPLTAPAGTGTSGGGGRVSGLGRLAGLDGLRAIAVLAVLAYHDDLLGGGFLGVDVFFVISGFLITGLLLAEHERRGRIDVKAFWLRRARRLLPALFLLLGCVLAFVIVVAPGEVARIRADVLAAFGYVTNWFLILGKQSYFEAVGRPSPLRHLWSLAVEEQFYVFWPLVLATALWLLRRRLSLALVVVAAVASAVWMAVLYVPYSDPSRVYYGTDTRIFGLLIGAALAFVWSPARWGGPVRSRDAWAVWGPGQRLVADLAAVAGLAAIALFFVFADEYGSFLYQGGFFLLAVVTAMVIAAVVHPASHVGPLVLDRQPLRWLGERSYSIYLWHWPVYMFTRPNLDVRLDGPADTALRLGLTLLLAEVSYRFVEMPIRYGALGTIWENWRTSAPSQRRRAYRVLVPAALVLALVTVAVGTEVVSAQPAAVPSYLAVGSVVGVVSADTPAPTRAASAAPSGAAPSRPAPGASMILVGASPSPSAANSAQVLPARGRIFAIGDSVILGAVRQLGAAIPGLEVNAEVGRFWSDGIDLLRRRAAAGTLPDIVIVEMGNNDRIFDKNFDDLMSALSGVKHVVIVNLRVSRDWQGRDNQTLSDGVRRYSKAVLVDWYAASAGHPELFWEDGEHLRPDGAKLYANLIAAAVAKVEALP